MAEDRRQKGCRNRRGAPGRPPLRLAALLAALLLLLPSAAWAEWGVELTPFAGFRFGGSFEDNAVGTDLEAGESAGFGVIVDVPAARNTQYELFYGFQRTELAPGAAPRFDLDVHYLHLGGTYLFPGERARPFVAAGLGLTLFDPQGATRDFETRFSVSLGGGVKIPFSERVGLRLEARGFVTVLPESTQIFCVSSGGAACDIRVQGDVFGQVQLLAGVSFSL